MTEQTKRKTEFWWASIAGADPEPVEKTEHDGRPCVYTCGCDDPFYLDGETVSVHFVNPMKRPLHPDKEAAAAAERAGRRNLKKTPAYQPHSWRGPR